MQVMVYLLDGPCEGTVTYSSALPTVLVVPVKTPHMQPTTGWHDYVRVRDTDRYSHSERCKCHART